jgi:hypothetical protein
MENSSEPIQIQLTAEQQELLSRLAGQSAQILELTPQGADATSGAGRGLQFRWRLPTPTDIANEKGMGGRPPADPSAGG